MPRRATLCLTLVLAFLLTGCVTLEHTHLTVYAERNESETSNERKGRTAGGKEGVSVTFDLR